MTANPDFPDLEVPARSVPVPTALSAEARAYLGRGPLMMPPGPALDDAEGWRNLITIVDQIIGQRLVESGHVAEDAVQVEQRTVGGVTIYDISPAGLDRDDTRVYFEAHGGAFTMGGGDVSRLTGIMTATRYGMRVWSVDYRMPPDHPFPAAVDDCVAAYEALLQECPADHVVVGGVSAGANLAAATILRARDGGSPLPAAAILLTPALDLTQSGDTFRTNLGVDTVITSDEGGGPALYAGSHDQTDPYLSPLFGEFSAGFPPTLLASGTRDVLLSDAVRMHRKLRAASIPADLHVLEAAPHGFFGGGTPEERELDREVRHFIDDRCPVPVS